VCVCLYIYIYVCVCVCIHTVQPLSIISQGKVEKHYKHEENNSCGKIYNVTEAQENSKKKKKIIHFPHMPTKTINK